MLTGFHPCSASLRLEDSCRVWEACPFLHCSRATLRQKRVKTNRTQRASPKSARLRSWPLTTVVMEEATRTLATRARLMEPTHASITATSRKSWPPWAARRPGLAGLVILEMKVVEVMEEATKEAISSAAPSHLEIWPSARIPLPPSAPTVR